MEVADGVEAGGDPTTGRIAGSQRVLSVDGPGGAEIVLLTHAHRDAGGAPVLAHRGTRQLLLARGRPSPALTFADQVRVGLGDRDVQVGWIGRGHTEGDAVAWVPDAGVLFAGGLVAVGTVPDCADACLAHWRSDTLTRLASFRATTLVPGRGAPVTGHAIRDAIEQTRAYLDTLCLSVARTVAAGGDLKAATEQAEDDLTPGFGHLARFAERLPANVTRAGGELQGRYY